MNFRIFVELGATLIMDKRNLYLIGDISGFTPQMARLVSMMNGRMQEPVPCQPLEEHEGVVADFPEDGTDHRAN